MITSSPGTSSSSRAAISSAEVHEWVSNDALAPVRWFNHA